MEDDPRDDAASSSGPVRLAGVKRPRGSVAEAAAPPAARVAAALVDPDDDEHEGTGAAAVPAVAAAPPPKKRGRPRKDSLPPAAAAAASPGGDQSRGVLAAQAAAALAAWKASRTSISSSSSSGGAADPASSSGGGAVAPPVVAATPSREHEAVEEADSPGSDNSDGSSSPAPPAAAARAPRGRGRGRGGSRGGARATQAAAPVSLASPRSDGGSTAVASDEEGAPGAATATAAAAPPASRGRGRGRGRGGSRGGARASTARAAASSSSSDGNDTSSDSGSDSGAASGEEQPAADAERGNDAPAAASPRGRGRGRGRGGSRGTGRAPPVARAAAAEGEGAGADAVQPEEGGAGDGGGDGDAAAAATSRGRVRSIEVGLNPAATPAPDANAPVTEGMGATALYHLARVRAAVRMGITSTAGLNMAEVSDFLDSAIVPAACVDLARYAGGQAEDADGCYYDPALHPDTRAFLGYIKAFSIKVWKDTPRVQKPCPHCGVVFKSRLGAKLHVIGEVCRPESERQRAAPVYDCPRCRLIFKTNTLLQSHLLEEEQCELAPEGTEPHEADRQGRGRPGRRPAVAPAEGDGDGEEEGGRRPRRARVAAAAAIAASAAAEEGGGGGYYEALTASSSLGEVGAEAAALVPLPPSAAALPAARPPAVLHGSGGGAMTDDEQEGVPATAAVFLFPLDGPAFLEGVFKSTTGSSGGAGAAAGSSRGAAGALDDVSSSSSSSSSSTVPATSAPTLGAARYLPSQDTVPDFDSTPGAAALGAVAGLKSHSLPRKLTSPLTQAFFGMALGGQEWTSPSEGVEGIAGGPVWAMDAFTDASHDKAAGAVKVWVVASAHARNREEHLVGVVSRGRNVLQLWTVEAPDTPVTTAARVSGKAATTPLPAMRLTTCIAHDADCAVDLAWCPHVAPDAEGDSAWRRLGVLAAVFGDGYTRVYAVPHPDSFSNNCNVDGSQGGGAATSSSSSSSSAAAFLPAAAAAGPVPVFSLLPVAVIPPGAGRAATRVVWDPVSSGSLFVGYTDGTVGWYALPTSPLPPPGVAGFGGGPLFDAVPAAALTPLELGFCDPRVSPLHTSSVPGVPYNRLVQLCGEAAAASPLVAVLRPRALLGSHVRAFEGLLWSSVCSLAVHHSADASILAVGHEDGSIRLWDLTAPGLPLTPVYAAAVAGRAIKGLHFHPGNPLALLFCAASGDMGEFDLVSFRVNHDGLQKGADALPRFAANDLALARLPGTAAGEGRYVVGAALSNGGAYLVQGLAPGAVLRIINDKSADVPKMLAGKAVGLKLVSASALSSVAASAGLLSPLGPLAPAVRETETGAAGSSGGAASAAMDDDDDDDSAAAAASASSSSSGASASGPVRAVTLTPAEAAAIAVRFAVVSPQFTDMMAFGWGLRQALVPDMTKAVVQAAAAAVAATAEVAAPEGDGSGAAAADGPDFSAALEARLRDLTQAHPSAFASSMQALLPLPSQSANRLRLLPVGDPRNGTVLTLVGSSDGTIRARVTAPEAEFTPLDGRAGYRAQLMRMSNTHTYLRKARGLADGDSGFIQLEGAGGELVPAGADASTEQLRAAFLDAGLSITGGDTVLRGKSHHLKCDAFAVRKEEEEAAPRGRGRRKAAAAAAIVDGSDSDEEGGGRAKKRASPANRKGGRGGGAARGGKGGGRAKGRGRRRKGSDSESEEEEFDSDATTSEEEDSADTYSSDEETEEEEPTESEEEEDSDD